jgi:hypothetical protein
VIKVRVDPIYQSGDGMAVIARAAVELGVSDGTQGQ